MAKALFITATGTDVGKTYVTGLIIKKLREAGYNAGYYKAALSGAELQADGSLLPGDAVQVATMAKLPANAEDLVSYIYQETLSPHLAAQREGTPVEMSKIVEDFAKAQRQYDLVTMEGSGGIICPLRWDEKHILLEDIIQELGLGVLVVASSTLGSINACVLTTTYLKLRGIPIRGIILNKFNPHDFMEQDNKQMIAQLTGVPIVAEVRKGAQNIDINMDVLLKMYK